MAYQDITVTVNTVFLAPFIDMVPSIYADAEINTTTSVADIILALYMDQSVQVDVRFSASRIYLGEVVDVSAKCDVRFNLSTPTLLTDLLGVVDDTSYKSITVYRDYQSLVI